MSIVWYIPIIVLENTKYHLKCGFDVQIYEITSKLFFKFDSMMTLNTFLARAVGVEEGFFGKIKGRDLGYQLDSLKKFRKHLFPLRVKLDSCHFDWEEGKTEYKFKDSKNKRSKNEYFATIDFSNKTDLFHFLANEPVGFMSKLKNL